MFSFLMRVHFNYINFNYIKMKAQTINRMFWVFSDISKCYIGSNLFIIL